MFILTPILHWLFLIQKVCTAAQDPLIMALNVLSGYISNYAPADRGLYGPGILLVSISMIFVVVPLFFEIYHMQSSELTIAKLRIFHK